MLRVAYQGEPGANSHIVAMEAFPGCETVPCRTFEDAFQSTQEGDSDFAMIAIDNSLAGRVADVHHMLPQSKLHIVGEHFLPINFHLMAVPSAKLANIKTAHSHIHALGQCRKVLRELKITPVVAVDTAGAARELAESGDTHRAAIATRLAAEIYGLKIIQESIEDDPHNTTRFVILSKEQKQPEAGSGHIITSFVFNVRNVPAALYKAMGGFATNSVNMTKLESYMVDGKFYATQFYAEIEGHPSDSGVALAMEELRFFTKEVRILGVYRAHPFRDVLAERAASANKNEKSKHA
jgi:prephenate dehydratase